MKNFALMIILPLSLFLSSMSYAATFLGANGVLYGNVCRAGLYYFILPFAPVGTPCYIDYNGVRWHGAISAE